jgi:hypothetical protein
MPRQFSILIATPAGYLHSRCFEEVALSLHDAFAALGFDAPVITDVGQVRGRAVVLGANLLPGLGVALPDGLILYNLEQIQKDSPWLNPAYLELLRRYPVWDYSERNIRGLKDVNVTNVALCGIGYMPSLTRIAPAPAQDIDVLFIGSTSERRMAILRELAAGGANVVLAYNSYGPERDAQIARAKLVINLHYYEAQVFEIVRVSYLLANRTCVVSEIGRDHKMEEPLHKGVAFATYGNLVRTCRRLLKDERERERIAEAGFAIFSGQSQVPMLKSALEATVPEAFSEQG